MHICVYMHTCYIEAYLLRPNNICGNIRLGESRSLPFRFQPFRYKIKKKILFKKTHKTIKATKIKIGAECFHLVPGQHGSFRMPDYSAVCARSSRPRLYLHWSRQGVCGVVWVVYGQRYASSGVARRHVEVQDSALIDHAFYVRMGVYRTTQCVYGEVRVTLQLLDTHLGNDTGRRTVTVAAPLLLTSGLVRYEAMLHTCGTNLVGCGY